MPHSIDIIKIGIRIHHETIVNTWQQIDCSGKGGFIISDESSAQTPIISASKKTRMKIAGNM
jgi:hypothetical protein